MPYRNILFATDLSEDVKKVCDKITFITQGFKAKLHLMHVIEPLPTYSYIELGPLDFEPAAQKALSTLGKRLEVPEERQLLTFGSVKNQLIEAVSKLSIDLMIVGYHDRLGLKWLFGSNASSLAREAGCDVLVLHHVCNE